MGGSITLPSEVEPDVRETGGSEPITGITDADERIVAEDVSDAENRSKTASMTEQSR
jgi:hypothetical protein